MNEADVVSLAKEAYFTLIKVAGPVLALGLLVGVIVALIQALTSLQEMTLTFVPKIIVVFTSVVVLAPYMIGVMVEFGRLLFDQMIAIG
ncbi:MAG: flagellar biosynthesis protein FliQ [Magnetospiraceae bacterium]